MNALSVPRAGSGLHALRPGASADSRSRTKPKPPEKAMKTMENHEKQTQRKPRGRNPWSNPVAKLVNILSQHHSPYPSTVRQAQAVRTFPRSSRACRESAMLAFRASLGLTHGKPGKISVHKSGTRKINLLEFMAHNIFYVFLE